MSTTNTQRGELTGCYVLDFHEIGLADVAVVGGKGARLGELSRIEGIQVPPGFCVTTAAFQRVMAGIPSIDNMLDRLSHLSADDREAIGEVSAQVRGAIEAAAIPDDLAEAITRPIARLGERDTYAVRSSATAEDLPNASFAGQQDSYLNVAGCGSILRHVSRCWASLFTERAVTYRLRNGFDHRRVRMAVVVQRMVVPRASGVLFTADPVSGHRKTAIVEACYGLGEALVSGLVNADMWTVRHGLLVETTTTMKAVALRPSTAGGTQEHAVPPRLQLRATLKRPEVLELVQLGRQIEAHFGSPQDIEWCRAGDTFQIVQSRPITNLFPIPAAKDDSPRVYVSVGHQQMMTDPMRPLGISMRQISNAGMVEAGSRMFVDVSRAMASHAGRTGLMEMLGKSDPLIGDALRTLVECDFISLSDASTCVPKKEPPSADAAVSIEADPGLVAALIAQSEASIAAVKRGIADKSGPALFKFILEDAKEMNRLAFDPQSLRILMAGIESTWWLNDHLRAWLGEKNVGDVLTRSAPGNITSEMGLDLLDVADAIRVHPEAVAFLQQAEGDDFLDILPTIPGGREARDALLAWLDTYGMRGVGEIDITSPRWSERPSMLLPMLLGNIRNLAPGAAKRRFEQGLQEALSKEREVLQRLLAFADGERKAAETKRMIDRVRAFIGYREYPKYAMMARYFVYKQALMSEADRLVESGGLEAREDAFFLTFDELSHLVRTGQADDRLIASRKEAFHAAQALKPPRVLTSEGECIAGTYRRDDLPEGALVGLAVSAGTVEGRARVLLDLKQADLDPGDILITPYTDPSWTPLFVGIKGLVTEVGGLMTHGAVIAREYGLPAVVGVEQASHLIRDGQRVRVDGTNGYVEILG